MLTRLAVISLRASLRSMLTRLAVISLRASLRSMLTRLSAQHSAIAPVAVQVAGAIVVYRPIVDDDQAVCARCGKTEPNPPPTWTLQTEAGKRSWLCETCTRDHVRSIEAKLDDQWW